MGVLAFQRAAGVGGGAGVGDPAGAGDGDNVLAADGFAGNEGRAKGLVASPQAASRARASTVIRRLMRSFWLATEARSMPERTEMSGFGP
jgi:hypothetical protein